MRHPRRRATSNRISDNLIAKEVREPETETDSQATELQNVFANTRSPKREAVRMVQSAGGSNLTCALASFGQFQNSE